MKIINTKSNIEEQTDEKIEIKVGTVTHFGSKVILFDDDVHTFDEVIVQLIKAISCSYAKAMKLTHEVNDSGKAVVFEGEMSDCLQVSSILEEISLHTQIEVN